MLQCSQPSQMPAGPRPRWISAATKLVGPHRTRYCAAHVPFPLNATRRGRRSFVVTHENRNPLSRLYRRAETLPRRIHHGPADQPGRARPRWRCRGQSKCGAERARSVAHQGAGQGARLRQEAGRPGKMEARGASVRRLSAAEAAGAGRCAAIAGGQFPLALLRPVLCRADAGFVHVPAADPQRHPETLAVFGAGRPDRAPVRAVLPMSPPAPICRCAKSRRRTRWR